MNYWNSLEATITTAVSSESIGQPVFLRLTTVLGCTADEIVSQFANLILLSSKCLGTTPVELFVSGNRASGHLTAIAEFENSATAIITLSRYGQLKVDLALYGNKGSIIHSESLDFFDCTLGLGVCERERDKLIAHIVESSNKNIAVRMEVR